MGILCRAMQDCISCLSQHAKGCIWQSNANSKYRCRAGFFDVETSDHIVFFTDEQQCGRTIPVDTVNIEGLHAEAWSSLTAILGIAATILVLFVFGWCFIYMQCTPGGTPWKSSHDQREEIELLSIGQGELDDN